MSDWVHMRSGDLLAYLFELSLQWHSFMYSMLFCSDSAQTYHFSEIQFVCDGRTVRRRGGRTDGWTEGRTTDRRTDTLTYTDARTPCFNLASLLI